MARTPRILLALVVAATGTVLLVFVAEAPGTTPMSRSRCPATLLSEEATVPPRLSDPAIAQAIRAAFEEEDASAASRMAALARCHRDLLLDLVLALGPPEDGEVAVAPRDAGRLLVLIGAPAVEPLCDALTEADPRMTRRILSCLRRMGPAAAGAAPDVVAFLRTATDEAFLSNALDTLGAMGSGAAAALPQLKVLLLDARVGSEVRRSAAEAVVAVLGPTPALFDACGGLLDDPGEAARGPLLEALEKLRGDALPIRPTVLRLLEDKDPAMRQRAAALVGAMGTADEQAIRGLVRLVSADEQPLRSTAAQALAALGPQGIAALSGIATAGAEATERLAALHALAASGFVVRDHLDPVLSLLDEPWPAGVRASAARFLGSLDPPARASAALPSLRRLAQGDSPSLRLASIRAAATLDGDEHAVVGFLLSCLEREDADATAVAAGLLGRFHAEAARIVPPLAEVMLTREEGRSASHASLRALLLAAPELRAELRSMRRRADPEGAERLELLLDETAAVASHR